MHARSAVLVTGPLALAKLTMQAIAQASINFVAIYTLSSNKIDRSSESFGCKCTGACGCLWKKTSWMSWQIKGCVTMISPRNTFGSWARGPFEASAPGHGPGRRNQRLFAENYQQNMEVVTIIHAAMLCFGLPISAVSAKLSWRDLETSQEGSRRHGGTKGEGADSADNFKWKRGPSLTYPSLQSESSMETTRISKGGARHRAAPPPGMARRRRRARCQCGAAVELKSNAPIYSRDKLETVIPGHYGVSSLSHLISPQSVLSPPQREQA